MNSPAMTGIFTVGGFNTANIVTSLLSAIVINLLNYIYGEVLLAPYLRRM
jgi:hypothetical protein